MKVSVIIVNYNVQYFLEVCLHSTLRALQQTTGEIIVVDNCSTDGSIPMLKERFPDVILIENKDNKGFGKANNQGVAIAKGEYILFLNPDTVLPEDFFAKAIGYMDEHPQAGCLGPKLLDGKGQLAPESKRSFPTLSVAIYKTTGINKLFSKSAYFNKYYAVHIGENETASVEVLMGCCMLLRKAVLEKILIAFDEDFFMYGEDIDLSYRIQKAGFQNIYFPETSIIHYKGESTKKSTLSYVRIFNEALSLFVKKNYPASKAKVFTLFINIGIVLRAVITLIRNFLSIIKMPLLDMLLLLGIFWGVKEFYLFDIKGYTEIKSMALLVTVPVYLLLWLGSMYLNGVYELSYNPLRVIRGMAVGTILAMAYYGLLQTEYRYSRVTILSTAFIGTILMLLMHRVLHHLKILKYIPYDKISRKTVIVANEREYADTADLMKITNYPLQLFGRVSINQDESEALSDFGEIKGTLYQAGVQEVIFCADDISYSQIFRLMQQCGKEYEYKIHISGSKGFVGSNSRHTSGDVYITAPKYHLSHSYHVRNKRIFDVCLALFILLFFPVAFFFRHPAHLLFNAFEVLLGRRTWVSYGKQVHQEKLPMIKKGVLPTFNLLNDIYPSEAVVEKLDVEYATHYNVFVDVRTVAKNLKFLSRK
ncbi:MAG TPA: glycosyltransferase [Flavipsychrobacter sp.]|nr:glycosyltransferase [Flavipsychrobacter sp.]